MKPSKQFEPIREAFISSYSEKKKKNQFTKVQMNIDADRILLDYFSNNLKAVENWFNIISPKKKNLTILKNELKELKSKNWTEILK